jgi:hypothetical protein
MKIIQNPETCPLCGYPRRGLEPGRLCPECGLDLLPDAPVLDFGVSSRRVRLSILAAGVLAQLALLAGWFRIPAPLNAAFDWQRFVLLQLCLGAAESIWLAWRFDRLRVKAVLSAGEIVFVRGGRVQWRLPYEDIVRCTGSWARGTVILRGKEGDRRQLPARTRGKQKTIISAIDEVLARCTR